MTPSTIRYSYLRYGTCRLPWSRGVARQSSENRVVRTEESGGEEWPSRRIGRVARLSRIGGGSNVDIKARGSGQHASTGRLLEKTVVGCHDQAARRSRPWGRERHRTVPYCHAGESRGAAPCGQPSNQRAL